MGGPQSFQYAMTQCCAVAVSLFGDIFLAAYLINGLRVRMFAMDNDIPFGATVCRLCVGSVFHAENQSAYCPISSIIALLLQFYIVYVVGRKCYSDEK